ncbi:MAG: hypothetical protein AAF363_01450 [Bacteroidota bacterium]
MVKKSKVKIAAYASLVIFALLFIFTFNQINTLNEALRTNKEKINLLGKEASLFQQLTEVDSIMLEGNHKAAVEAYKELIASNANNRVIEIRLGLAERYLLLEDSLLNKDYQAIDTVERSVTDKNIASERVPLRSYDSMNFALRKAQEQISMLMNQLENKSFGEFLEFSSKEGNLITYVGQVKGGKANGKGVAIYSTGSRYDGQWKQNQRHGKGTFYWPDGQHYVGDYKNDQRSGEGTYYWPDGKKFVGGWKNDLRSGNGVFYDPDNEIIARGVWEKDELVKKMKK